MGHGKVLGRLAAVISILCVLGLACSQPEPATSTPGPTLTPEPTSTPIPGWAAYTDKSNLFKIEYPLEWKVEQSIIREVEVEVENFIRGKTSAPRSNSSTLVFFAGLRDEVGYDPNVNVFVGTMPSEWSIQEYYERSSDGIKETIPSVRLIESTDVRIGTKAAMIFDSEANSSDIDPRLTGVFHVKQLATVEGRIAWIVSCSIVDEVSQHNLDICDTIVRTFRIVE